MDDSTEKTALDKARDDAILLLAALRTRTSESNGLAYPSMPNAFYMFHRLLQVDESDLSVTLNVLGTSRGEIEELVHEHNRRLCIVWIAKCRAATAAGRELPSRATFDAAFEYSGFDRNEEPENIFKAFGTTLEEMVRFAP